MNDQESRYKAPWRHRITIIFLQIVWIDGSLRRFAGIVRRAVHEPSSSAETRSCRAFLLPRDFSGGRTFPNVTSHWRMSDDRRSIERTFGRLGCRRSRRSHRAQFEIAFRALASLSDKKKAAITLGDWRRCGVIFIGTDRTYVSFTRRSARPQPTASFRDAPPALERRIRARCRPGRTRGLYRCDGPHLLHEGAQAPAARRIGSDGRQHAPVERLLVDRAVGHVGRLDPGRGVEGNRPHATAGGRSRLGDGRVQPLFRNHPIHVERKRPADPRRGSVRLERLWFPGSAPRLGAGRHHLTPEATAFPGRACSSTACARLASL